MDLWVVAAAAGAGYIAKNIQNLSLDKRETTPYKSSYSTQSESRNFLQQLRERTCPLRRLERERAQGNVFPDVENHSDVNFFEVDRSRNRDTEASVDSSIIDESLEENKNLSRFNRGKKIIGSNRNCRVHSMRPLNSLGSCIDAQICRDKENMEDNAFLLYPSISTVRPVLVTDGSRIISHSSSNSSLAQFEDCTDEVRRDNGVGLKVASNTVLSSSLGQFGSVEGIRERKNCSADSQVMFGRSLHSQGPDSMLLFITGMTVGILSATAAWKNEVDKSNKQLNQMQNLVQDLQEELDMKDRLMVKEITDEGYRLPVVENNTIQEPTASPSDEKVNELTKFDGPESNEKNKESIELLSRIEAELEAELEMLENNLKASALERISSVVELDPDFEPDIVRGDLNSTMVNGMSDSENETTDTDNNCSQPVNYAVSPRELSLQLHELIESRLETRIRELEIALANSQNSVQVLGSQRTVSRKSFSYSGTETSSTTLQSPTCTCNELDEREDGRYTENFYSSYVEAGKDQERGNGNSVWDEQRLASFMSNRDFLSEDEGADESEMLLIKKIVEKRKSSSNFNLGFY